MSFDPYHVWLSIPPSEQPPNHYRLLGIPLYEANFDVIESAADRQMKHLRTFQTGPNSACSQRLLMEVSKARVCLLNPDEKRGYDQQLRVKLAPPATLRPAAAPVVAAMPVAAVPVAPQYPQAVRPAGPLVFEAPAPGLNINTRPASAPAVRGRSQKASPLIGVGITGVSLAALVAAIVWFKSNEQAPVAAEPAPPPVQPAPAPRLSKVPDRGGPEKLPKLPVRPEVDPLAPADAPDVPNLPLTSVAPAAPLAANTAVPKRISPIPAETTLAAAKGKIAAEHSDELKNARSQPQKRDLAQRFLNQGLAETRDDGLRYALLQQTITTANEAGRYDISVKAIEALAEQYRVDPMPLREASLDYCDRLAKSKTELRMAAEGWRELAWLAVNAQNFDTALRASQKAAAIAREADDKALLKRMVDSLSDVKQRASVQTTR